MPTREVSEQDKLARSTNYAAWATLMFTVLCFAGTVVALLKSFHIWR